MEVMGVAAMAAGVTAKEEAMGVAAMAAGATAKEEETGAMETAEAAAEVKEVVGMEVEEEEVQADYEATEMEAASTIYIQNHVFVKCLCSADGHGQSLQWTVLMSSWRVRRKPSWRMRRKPSCTAFTTCSLRLRKITLVSKSN